MPLPLPLTPLTPALQARLHVMGKHNGKARKSKGAVSVGSALVNRARREGRTGTAAAYLHTTDASSNKPNMQSVIETNDLDEMMAMVGVVWSKPVLVALLFGGRTAAARLSAHQPCSRLR